MLQDRSMASPARIASDWVNFLENQLDSGPEWEAAREAFHIKFPHAIHALIREVACEVEKIDTPQAHHVASTLLALKITHYLVLGGLLLAGLSSPG